VVGRLVEQHARRTTRNESGERESRPLTAGQAGRLGGPVDAAETEPVGRLEGAPVGVPDVAQLAPLEQVGVLLDDLRVVESRGELLQASGTALVASRWNTPQKCRATASSASATVMSRPVSCLSDVTPRFDIPHGTIRSKCSRLVFTLKAKPWLVIQREIRMPIAPIFRSPIHVPVRP
jgi:hypothetical protein